MAKGGDIQPSGCFGLKGQEENRRNHTEKSKPMASAVTAVGEETHGLWQRSVRRLMDSAARRVLQSTKDCTHLNYVALICCLLLKLLQIVFLTISHVYISLIIFIQHSPPIKPFPWNSTRKSFTSKKVSFLFWYPKKNNNNPRVWFWLLASMGSFPGSWDLVDGCIWKKNKSYLPAATNWW